MLFSLLSYKGKIIYKGKKKVGVIGYIGVAFGFLSAGCAVCGLGLIGFLGLTGIITSLPFKGNEFPVIGIVFLLISIYIISRDMYICKVKN